MVGKFAKLSNIEFFNNSFVVFSNVASIGKKYIITDTTARSKIHTGY